MHHQRHVVFQLVLLSTYGFAAAVAAFSITTPTAVPFSPSCTKIGGGGASGQTVADRKITVSPPPAIRSSSLAAASTGGNNEEEENTSVGRISTNANERHVGAAASTKKREGAAGGTKRRFLQQAHERQQQQQTRRLPAKDKRGKEIFNTATARPPLAGTIITTTTTTTTSSTTPTKRKKAIPSTPITTSSSSSSSSSSAATISRGPPLRTGKTIEELEDVMIRRWGTALSTSSSSNKSSSTSKSSKSSTSKSSTTHDDDDDDDDDEVDDDTEMVIEYQDGSSSGNSGSSSSNNIMSSASPRTTTANNDNSNNSNKRRTRGRLVIDPWAKEEESSSSSITTTASVNDDEASTLLRQRRRELSPREKRRRLERDVQQRQDKIIDRVRANQERLVRRRRRRHHQGSSNNDDDDDEATNEKVSEQQLLQRTSNNLDNDDDDDDENYYKAVNVIPRDYYDVDDDDEWYDDSNNSNGGGIRQSTTTSTEEERMNHRHQKRILESSSPSKTTLLSSRMGGIFSPRKYTTVIPSTIKTRQDGGGMKSNGAGSSNGAAVKNSKTSTAATSADVASVVTKKKTKQLSKLVPRLDEDGNEMLLTLDQATKIVNRIIASSSSLESNDSSSSSGTLTIDDVNNKNNNMRKINSWEDIGITDSTLLTNLQSSTNIGDGGLGCTYPLPVQERTCPAIIAMNDVLVSTHTGSGKTLSFLVPIIQNLLIENNSNLKQSSSSSTAYPRAIVIAPGRELASQIVSVARSLLLNTGLSVELAIGGTPYTRNVDRIRKVHPDIIIGTPGRIAELIIGRPGEDYGGNSKKSIAGGKVKISGVRCIVLDEFDALLQYNAHVEPTVAIMDALIRQHGRALQRILCSATASDVIHASSSSSSSNVEGEGRISAPISTDEINIESYLRPGYAHASVDDSDLLVTSGIITKIDGSSSTATTMTSIAPRVSRTTIHGTLHVPSQRLALEAVRKILNTEPVPQQALIFVDSSRRVDIVIDKLAQMDIIAAPLHGGTTSGKSDRAQVNKALREGYVGIVVATEMAARGIDAPYLTHCINLDLPTDASHYAHRAGRCGRGGRPGVSISITCTAQEKGVPRRFAEELGITMYNVEAREGKLRIVEG